MKRSESFAVVLTALVAAVLMYAFLAAQLTAQTVSTVPQGPPLVSNEGTGFGNLVGATVRGGVKGSTTAAFVTSESVDANTQALHIFIKNTAVPTNPIQIGGNTISTGHGVPDTGTQRVFLAQKASYVAATAAKTATAAGTTPFWSICGSATKTVRLQYVEIDGTVATAAIYGDVELTKTSTATSAGTPTALTKVPHDSNAAASTVNLLNYYTALATAGTAVGKIGSKGAVFPITGTVAAQQGSVVFDWTNRQESEAPVLRGTAQCVEASFGTTPTNAPTLTVMAVFTEE